MKPHLIRHLKIAMFVCLIAAGLYVMMQHSTTLNHSSYLKSEVLHTSPNNTDMLYKLYVSRNKVASDQSRGVQLYPEFSKIYSENGVEVVGVWVNADDTHEIYFMTAFKDQGHYDSFVEKMKGNEHYQDMSAEIAGERESIKAVNLKMVSP